MSDTQTSFFSLSVPNAFKSCVYPMASVVDMISDSPPINAALEGKFGALKGRGLVIHHWDFGCVGVGRCMIFVSCDAFVSPILFLMLLVGALYL